MKISKIENIYMTLWEHQKGGKSLYGKWEAF